MSTQNADSRPRFDWNYLPRARALLQPEWRAFPPLTSVLHAHDCIFLSCCSIARNIGVALEAFDDENFEAVHTCLLAARASSEDIDRVLALNGWYQSTAFPEQPPCSTAELWRIATRVYRHAVRMSAEAETDNIATTSSADDDALSNADSGPNQDDGDDLAPVVIVDIFQGSVTDAVASPLALWEFNGRVECSTGPRPKVKSRICSEVSMLVVTIELLPRGSEVGRKTLGEALIINTGGDAAYGSYLIKLGENGSEIAEGKLADYPRFAGTVFDLVARGIATALSGVEELPPRPVHAWRQSEDQQ